MMQIKRRLATAYEELGGTRIGEAGMNAAPDRSKPQDRDHAGVRIPPPKLFLAGLALGFLLEWLWPLGWFEGLPTLPRLGLGGVLTAAGVALMASAMGLFKKAGTAIPPWEPTTALVTAGVYRFSRNPIYLSVVLIYVGLALLFAWGWALLLLVPVLVILQLAVIRREEAYLERRFGDHYRQYRARVRRWL
jgi:protein-S-isoprenylcysteine O-methyltransferase Ste14